MIRAIAVYVPALIFAAAIFLLFTRVGHLAGPYFKAFSLLEFAGATLFGFLFYRLRYFAFAFCIIALPRVLSIGLGRDSHNLLFCAFAGLSLGVFTRAVLTFRAEQKMDGTAETTDERKVRSSAALMLFLFVGFLISRSLLEYYAPSLTTNLSLKDREVTAGVSANYAFYLSSLVAVNLLGPLLFIIADARSRALGLDQVDNEVLARELLKGFAVGGILCLLVVALQEAGVARLFAGSARSLQHFRPPGLFTDSGSAAVLLPVTLYTVYLFVARVDASVSKLRRKLSAFILLLVLFALAIHQGRGYILSLAGLGFGLLLIRLARGPNRPAILFTLITAPLIAAALLWTSANWIPAANRLTAELTGAVTSLGEPSTAYARLDPVRAQLFHAGLDVFRAHPWIGSGLNSFMVETAHLVRAGKLVADNPSMLFTGVLSDVGIMGSLFLLALILMYGLKLMETFRAGDEHVFRVHALPLFCLPTFFIGYHVVFAEFGAFLLTPLLFWPRAGTLPGPMRYSAALLLAAYIATAALLLLTR